MLLAGSVPSTICISGGISRGNGSQGCCRGTAGGRYRDASAAAQHGRIGINGQHWQSGLLCPHVGCRWSPPDVTAMKHATPAMGLCVHQCFCGSSEKARELSTFLMSCKILNLGLDCKTLLNNDSMLKSHCSLGCQGTAMRESWQLWRWRCRHCCGRQSWPGHISSYFYGSCGGGLLIGRAALPATAHVMFCKLTVVGCPSSCSYTVHACSAAYPSKVKKQGRVSN